MKSWMLRTMEPSLLNMFHTLPYWEKEWRRLKKEQLVGKARVATATICVGHSHLIATPALAVTVASSTPTPLAPMPSPGNFGRAFHAHDTSDTG